MVMVMESFYIGFWLTNCYGLEAAWLGFLCEIFMMMIGGSN
jgi:hypothetical protein